MDVEPFEIAVGDDVLADLQERLRRTRWPSAAPGAPWSQGTDLAYLQDLCAYWADGFDWRERETRLNRLEHFLADVDGVRVHFVHVRRGGTPLILTHGWPSAFTEYLPLVDRLDGFDLVIPSLPGYGFSARPDTLTIRDTAKLWHALMRGLGYERYGAGGTDWGAGVTAYMALDDPAPLLGIHFSNLDVWPAAEPETDGGARLRRSHRALGRGRTRVQHPAEHAAADAGLRPDRLSRRARRLDPREVAGVVRQRRRARGRLRPRLPARARDALLGHGHDRHLAARLHRQLHGGHAEASRSA